MISDSGILNFGFEIGLVELVSRLLCFGVEVDEVGMRSEMENSELWKFFFDSRKLSANDY